MRTPPIILWGKGEGWSEEEAPELGAGRGKVEGGYSPNIFVAQEGHQVDSGEVCVDSDKVETEQDGQHLQCQPGQRRARLQPQEVWGEPVSTQSLSFS